MKVSIFSMQSVGYVCTYKWSYCELSQWLHRGGLEFQIQLLKTLTVSMLNTRDTLTIENYLKETSLKKTAITNYGWATSRFVTVDIHYLATCLPSHTYAYFSLVICKRKDLPICNLPAKSSPASPPLDFSLLLLLNLNLLQKIKIILMLLNFTIVFVCLECS